MGECCPRHEGCGSNSCACNCSCCVERRSGHVCGEEKEGFAEWLFEVADEAWTEVLKENIKDHIVKTQGARMKELAKIVSEGNSTRWKNKMAKKHSCGEFQEKLMRFFNQSKK